MLIELIQKIPLLGPMFFPVEDVTIPIATPPPAFVASSYSPRDLAEILEIDPCDGFAHSCGDIRRVWLDLSDLGEPGGVWLHYDFDEVTRKLRRSEMKFESELSLAVRLIISEVGADRMVASQHSLMESIGILYTVDNRLDPAVYNPLGHPRAPIFPGCGQSGSFYSCANAQQYLGMATWRAYNPRRHYTDEMLSSATDLAVMAWYLQERRLIADPTGGSTSYVHRCGGAAYGRSTPHCDGHLGRPWGDIPGADPHTGPILFKAPTRWLRHRGHYRYEPTKFIDYEPWPSPALTDDAADDVVADALDGI
ncbi:MAG: hypothetical protein AAFV53_14835 [Myxococcota bacterium]